MSTGHIWRTTTTEIMEIFRQSLIVLVPLMEKAHLPWKEREAYDEWDRIAGSLFEGIVVSSLEWGLGAGEFTHISIPEYDMVYPGYGEMSFIECSSGSQTGDSYLLFHKFTSSAHPFDTVQCVQVDAQGRKVVSGHVTKPSAGTRFLFRLRSASKELVACENLTIQERGKV